MATVNIESDMRNGDALDKRPDDPLCALSEEDHVIFTLSAKERGLVITKEILAQRWGIGLDTATGLSLQQHKPGSGAFYTQ